MKSTKIIFFGNEQLATGVNNTCIVLKKLVENGYDIRALVLSQSIITSRKQTTLDIEKIALNYGIPVLKPTKLTEILPDLLNLQAQIGILVAYGKIVPENIISKFSKGIVNLHPSLLPYHRGPTPIESSILAGDDKTGISLMKLVKEMDAGPIYAQKSISLKHNPSKQDICTQLTEIGADMLVELLPDITSDRIKPVDQDHAKATYDQKISKEDGIINWQLPAEQILRTVRAYSGWPGSKTTLSGYDITVTSARFDPSNGEPGEMFIIDNKILGVYAEKNAVIIDKLIISGRSEMISRDFINGYLKKKS